REGASSEARLVSTGAPASGDGPWQVQQRSASSFCTSHGSSPAAVGTVAPPLPPPIVPGPLPPPVPAIAPPLPGVGPPAIAPVPAGDAVSGPRPDPSTTPTHPRGNSTDATRSESFISATSLSFAPR